MNDVRARKHRVHDIDFARSAWVPRRFPATGLDRGHRDDHANVESRPNCADRVVQTMETLDLVTVLHPSRKGSGEYRSRRKMSAFAMPSLEICIGGIETPQVGGCERATEGRTRADRQRAPHCVFSWLRTTTWPPPSTPCT
jgi:hypothetical protein